ncbi:MAG: DUF63 family protein [Methanophagales archaeon]|nr:DUF63 family protein [Methanophagales archaeon]
METYYLHPITHDTVYNPINTITWALPCLQHQQNYKKRL